MCAIGVAFLDLKAAFNSLSQIMPWKIVEASPLNLWLLMLIHSLYVDKSLKVRCNPKGFISKAVSAQNRVKQGCILAPLLFNYYINSTVSHLPNPDFHSSKLPDRCNSIPLNIDNSIFLSRTSIRLKRTWIIFGYYCRINQLDINYQKTDINF